MGETANIQRQNIPYAQLIVLRYETPYYKKGLDEQKDKIPSKIEVINEKDLSKYVKLVFDTQQAHRPFAIGILLVEINETTCEVKKIKPNFVLDSNFAEVLETKLSVSNLFQEVSDFAKFYKTQL
ncbi:MAG: hypothetical protein KatS3mg035_1313 [Bacteroidia bacterium]|nr:MAG: hypothetical protein KatS3mg035_1313 [Bacteroidia bacterium]